MSNQMEFKSELPCYKLFLGPWEHCNPEAKLELQDYLVLDMAAGLVRKIAAFFRDFWFYLTGNRMLLTPWDSLNPIFLILLYWYRVLRIV